MRADVQVVVLGTGDWKYENMMKSVEERHPNKFRAILAFSSDLASKLYGASDIFLMPSKFEPCGLSQLIAMRYGSVPVVRETGGLKDTVPAFNPETGEGKGFTFKTYNAYDMLDAVWRAYRNLQRQGQLGFDCSQRYEVGFRLGRQRKEICRDLSKSLIKNNIYVVTTMRRIKKENIIIFRPGESGRKERI